jgi:hypothetical protein
MFLFGKALIAFQFSDVAVDFVGDFPRRMSLSFCRLMLALIPA